MNLWAEEVYVHRIISIAVKTSFADIQIHLAISLSVLEDYLTQNHRTLMNSQIFPGKKVQKYSFITNK